MSWWFWVVAYVGAVDPPRTRLALPETDDGRARLGLVAAGSAAGLAVLILLGLAAGWLLDALQISPETFRIAAGLVLLIGAARFIFDPTPVSEPVAPGRLGAVWPVAFPLVLSAEAMTLALTTGASDGIGSVVVGGATAVAGLVALAAVPSGPVSRRVVAALGRVVAAVLVVVAVWLALQGVREV